MMRNTLIVGLTVLSTVCWSDDTQSAPTHKTHKTHRAAKRLNTSPTDTEDGSWVFGTESQLYSGATYLNPTIGYSGVDNWNVSVSSYNIPLNDGALSSDYETYVAITKTFDMTDRISLMVSSHNGISLVPTTGRRWLNMELADLRYSITDRLTTYGGVYFANDALTSTANKAGFLAGFVAKLIPNTLHLQGDYVSGHSSMSGAEVDLQWYAAHNTQLYIGIIVPEKNSGNEFAGVVGINISTKDLVK